MDINFGYCLYLTFNDDSELYGLRKMSPGMYKVKI
jgi:hypothetical protein